VTVTVTESKADTTTAAATVRGGRNREWWWIIESEYSDKKNQPANRQKDWTKTGKNQSETQTESTVDDDDDAIAAAAAATVVEEDLAFWVDW